MWNWPRYRSGSIVSLVGLATLGSGAINIYSVIGPSPHTRVQLLREFFPLEFLGVSRFLTLLIGFFLVTSSLNIFKRKRRAFTCVLFLAAASVVFHLTKGIDYEEAAFSVVLLILLYAARRHFTVKSRTPGFKGSLVRIGLALVIAFAYGAAGFWLLRPRHFGVNFHIGEAVHQTLLFLSLVGDPQVVPHTWYARWFVNSLYLITVTAFAYSGFALFRPVLYRYKAHVRERAAARAIAVRHGISALDHFKTSDDKSFFFSPSRRTFLAYRVAANFAVVLGDPVGPEVEIEAIVTAFAQFCGDNDWGVAFYQALPGYREIYRRAGLKALKIGDEAIVDVCAFSLEGKSMKATRTAVRKLEKAGMEAHYIPAPAPEQILDEIEEVSNEWLRIPGRRERAFTLGRFDRASIRSTALLLVRESAAGGRVLGFANLIPSGRRDELTVDLMRRRPDAPNGIMDFLFVHLFLHAKEAGLSRFSLGMAPMAGFQEHERASAEERAVHAFFQRLNFLFSFRGLRAYKAKFATRWEPRYVYYTHALQLPRLALALGKVSTFKEPSNVEEDRAGTGGGDLVLRAEHASRNKPDHDSGPVDRDLLHPGAEQDSAAALCAVRPG